MFLGQEYVGYYHSSLVVVAFVIGIVTSYVSIYLLYTKFTKHWLVVASVIMGGGIWAVHFLSMISLHLNITVSYNAGLVILSFVAAVIGSFFTFQLCRIRQKSTVLLSSLAMGGGISAMHYTGMTSMILETKIIYNPFFVVLSVFSATILSGIAVWFLSKVNHGRNQIFRILGAVFFGFAIAAMHYIGMSATNLVSHQSSGLFSGGVYEISDLLLGWAISLFLLIILLSVLIIVVLNKHFANKLKESEEQYRQLVESSPEPIIVYQNDKIVFVNEKLEELLGYHADEIIGESIFNFILVDYHSLVRTRISKLYKHILKNRLAIKIKAKGNKILDIEVASALVIYQNQLSIEVFIRDVTERNRMEEEIRKNDELYRFITENSMELITSITPVGVYEYVSPSCKQLLGYESDDMIGQVAHNFFHPEERESIGGLLEDATASLDYALLSHRIRKKDGSYIWLETKGRVIRTISGELEKIVTVSRDITTILEKENKLQEKIRILEYTSNMDALTAIPNRRYFDEKLQNEWKRVMRYGRPLSVLMIDIDYFKNLNDEYGHQAGDECLKQIATALKNTVNRPSDFVARYGGEEFIILLPETDETGAAHVGHLLLNSVRNLKIPNKDSEYEYATVSIGAATVVPTKNLKADALIKCADEALYEAKTSGRNQYKS